MTSYRWEASAERSWDDLEEDSSGLLHDAQAAAHYKTQRLEYASRSAKWGWVVPASSSAPARAA